MLFKNCRKICLEIAEKLDDKEDEAGSPELNYVVIFVSFRFSAIFPITKIDQHAKLTYVTDIALGFKVEGFKVLKCRDTELLWTSVSFWEYGCDVGTAKFLEVRKVVLLCPIQ